MKATHFANKFFVAAVMVMATSAFAAEKGSMKLIQPAMIGGVQLAPGEYSLSWEGSGPNVEVKITKDSKLVATAPAKTVDLKNSAPANGTTTKPNADGKAAISEVFFRGKTRALEIGSPDAATQSMEASK